MSQQLQRTKHKWTKGISVTNNTNDLWFFFFEIDHPYTESTVDKIDRVYSDYSLDVLKHRTGNGLHWNSPTLLHKEEYLKVRDNLKDINPMCPMFTLRSIPNKYVNEKEIWFNHSARKYYDNVFRNSFELCNLLNKWFGFHRFTGIKHTTTKHSPCVALLTNEAFTADYTTHLNNLLKNRPIRSIIEGSFLALIVSIKFSGLNSLGTGTSGISSSFLANSI